MAFPSSHAKTQNSEHELWQKRMTGDNRASVYYSDINHLRSAIEAVMIGGNHLVSIIGPNEILPYRYSAESALEYYGAGPKYDAWCCWKSIMMLRDAKGILYENC